jgi:hypothetical protein
MLGREAQAGQEQQYRQGKRVLHAYSAGVGVGFARNAANLKQKHVGLGCGIGFCINHRPDLSHLNPLTPSPQGTSTP